jgi:hypothetical protein
MCLQFGFLWLVHVGVTAVCCQHFWWLTPEMLPVLGMDSCILLLELSGSQTVNPRLNSARTFPIIYCPPGLSWGSILCQTYRSIHVSNLYKMYVHCICMLALGNNVWGHIVTIGRLLAVAPANLSNQTPLGNFLIKSWYPFRHGHDYPFTPLTICVGIWFGGWSKFSHCCPAYLVCCRNNHEI